MSHPLAIWLCASILAIAASSAAGQTAYESTQGGDWSQACTWNPVGVPVPLSPDSALVKHSVQVKTGAQGAGAIQVPSEATLSIVRSGGEHGALVPTAADIQGGFTTVNTPPGLGIEGVQVGSSLRTTVVASQGGCPALLAAASFSVGDNPEQVVHDDLNGDGVTDLLVINGLSDDVSVLLGVGGGDFEPAVHYPAGERPVSLVTGDLDANGAPDIVVAAKDGDEVPVLLGLGDGTFVSVGAYPVPEAPSALALGDLNGDGILDLVVASGAQFRLVVMFGNGAGGFGPHSWHDLDAEPRLVSLGDLDGDGDLDVVVATASLSLSDVSVLLGNGDGTLSSAQTYAIGSSSHGHQLVLEDLNGDGVLDAAMPSTGEYAVSILFGVGDGSFQPLVLVPVPGPVHEIAAGDLTADGVTDMVVSALFAEKIWILVGSGDGTFDVQEAASTGGLPQGMQVCDVDGDAKSDLVLTLIQGDALNVHLSGSSWARLQGGKPGAAGTPSLWGEGCALPGSGAELHLSGAAPLASMAIVVGLSVADVAFKGGIMLPAPDVVVDELLTDAQGGIVLPFVWPGDLLGGFSLWAQAWVLDATATHGYAASNGLRSDVP
jgi:hypothetical protein